MAWKMIKTCICYTDVSLEAAKVLSAVFVDVSTSAVLLEPPLFGAVATQLMNRSFYALYQRPGRRKLNLFHL